MTTISSYCIVCDLFTDAFRVCTNSSRKSVLSIGHMNVSTLLHIERCQEVHVPGDTFAYPNTLGQNTSVENKPCLESEWDGDQHRVSGFRLIYWWLWSEHVTQDTVNNDPADQMVRWNSGTEDVKLSPVRSSRPRPVEDVNPNTGISGNDSSEVVNSNSAISLVPENTNIQTTKRKGKEVCIHILSLFFLQAS